MVAMFGLDRFMVSYRNEGVLLQDRIRSGSQPTLPLTSPVFLICANAFYLFFTWALHSYMKARAEPCRCAAFKNILLVYNFICVFLAGYVAVGIIYVFLQGGLKTGFVCNSLMSVGGPEDNGYAGLLAHLFWVFYIQKFWEFFDTWFFILRKSFRQVTFLHFFHHSSINIVVGLILPFEHNGDMYLPILLNATVHVLMYSHYAVAALGFSTPWKPYLTSMQLMQFLTIATQSTMSMRRGDGCGSPFFAKWVMIIYMASMLALFGNFFFHSYILKKPAPSSTGVVKIPEPVQSTRSYSGRAVLDEDGDAIVDLPAFFADGNVHYHVTPIGKPMPNLHVSREPIEANCSFALSGGISGAAVSWTVTKVVVMLQRPELTSCCDTSQEKKDK